MNPKDHKRSIAHDALILIGLLFLLVYICRIWPILLLMILGIFIAALRFLFIVLKEAKPPNLEPVRALLPTERDVKGETYSAIIQRITELVLADFPAAHWVWEHPNAKASIERGEPVFILLNQAGGYRRARIVIQDLQVIGICYCTGAEASDPNEKSLSEEKKENQIEISDISADTESEGEPVPVNYDLMAFEWVESHIVSLNERCNEAIGSKKQFLLLEDQELPAKESWNDICKELERSGLEQIRCLENGIQINFK